MTEKRKIKVLVVDDSAMVRRTLTELLSSDPEIEVMATAADPFIAADRMKEDIPDVITVDIEMPRMDGISFLQKVMTQHPIPIVICSSVAENGSDNALRAMECGAVDIIEKPRMGTQQFLMESKIRICDAVKAAAKVKVAPLKSGCPFPEKKLSADVVLEKPIRNQVIRTTDKIVMVGASTGGTEALRVFLEAFPVDSPGIVIVLHMPEQFTRAYSERLNTLCKIDVKEAENGDSVLRGRALIAKGNHHMILKRNGAKYFVEVKEGPLVSRHRPSVDVLFRSAARYAGRNAIGVILTGMGDDGAKGMLEMKETGAFNIAQDQATSVVFGMPHEAIKLGATDSVCPLEDIAPLVLKKSREY
ncbi:MAG: chemotaxis response regulator protein-glutamate methylesterase [Desulfobacteraceae bacterium]|nr:chemotaxis response regulator protein-glutamate methylesterase [Desulfobacteraceae bacterium]MBU4053064.1 chemotaxis response regulator protein-glutamate methylesterase [Pseudomonadota bacterium]